MTAHPLDAILATGVSVDKATLKAEIKKYAREWDSVAAFRLIDMSGVASAIIAGKLYLYDSADTTTDDDGAVCVHDVASRRFKRQILVRTELGTNRTNNDASANTIADITGLSFAVIAAIKYKFRFVIHYTAAATTTGARFSINGPAAPTKLTFSSQWTVTATTRVINDLAAYDLPAAAGSDSLTAGNIAIIEGEITPSVDGTLIARFASEVSGSAIVALAGSYVEYEVIP